jgi:hypothetical protein
MRIVKDSAQAIRGNIFDRHDPAHDHVTVGSEGGETRESPVDVDETSWNCRDLRSVPGCAAKSSAQRGKDERAVHDESVI